MTYEELVAEAQRLVERLDDEWYTNGDSQRYHDYRDDIFDFVDRHPEAATLVADVIPV
jgi:predicted protein tyrosine phosphatase